MVVHLALRIQTKTLEKTDVEIQNGQSRETGSITIHRTNANKTKNTTQKTKA
jgi:hypothetical protein